MLKSNCNAIYIQSITGGIVNFGGTLKIAPITISRTTAGSPAASEQMTNAGNELSTLSGATAALEGAEGTQPS